MGEILPRHIRSAPDTQAIEREVAQLATADRASLRVRWRKVFCGEPPQGVYRELMARILAYKLQADAFGDLDRVTKQKLARIAKGDETAWDDARSRLKPGTILVREWKGVLHHVTVLDAGYAWDGKTYVSLSAVARAIAGTHWNGPAFFGLTTGKKRKGQGNG